MSDRSGAVSISICAQKKRLVAGLVVVRKIDWFRNFIRLAFQASPFQGVGIARTADYHLLAANNNHDVANPGSRITSDGYYRRSKLLGHGRVANSRWDRRNRPKPAVPVGPRAAGSYPRLRLDLTHARFRSCGVWGAKGKCRRNDFQKVSYALSGCLAVLVARRGPVAHADPWTEWRGRVSAARARGAGLQLTPQPSRCRLGFRSRWHRRLSRQSQEKGDGVTPAGFF
jgi:hypothetical protein